MRRVLISAVGVVISVAAILFVIRSVDLGHVVEAMARAQPLTLAATVPLFAAGIALRSYRWQRLLPTRGRRVPVRRIVPVLLVGYLGNAVLPARLGEPIRAYLLARREQMSASEVLGTAVLERIIDLSVLAVMAFAGAWLIAAPAWAVQLTAIAALGATTIVVVLALVDLVPLMRSVRSRVGSESGQGVDRLLAPIERFARGIGAEHRRRPVAEAALISFPIWLVDSAICVVVAVALGIELSPAAAVLVIGIGALGTSVPSAPGYLGTYELAVSAAAGAVGVPATSALALAVLLHAASLIPVAIGGLFSLSMLRVTGLFELAREAEAISPR
jgi:uncharacterized protein (TIRG00374 family)